MKKVNLAFSELPFEGQLALYEYLKVYGYETLDSVADCYSQTRFIYEIISIQEAKRRFLAHMAEMPWDCKTFEDYHKEYVGDGSDIPDHGDSMFPVIEGGDGEWLEDGWHRFHSYIKHKKTHIPVLSFCSVVKSKAH